MSESAPSLQEEKKNEIQSLPPRSEVHRKRDAKKKKRHIQYLFIRFLVAVFILLPVAVYFFTNRYIVQKQKELQQNSKIFEEIFFEKKNAQTEQTKQSNQTGTFTFHKVTEGETLESIAKFYFPNDDGVSIILKNNSLPNNSVTVGQVLKIPSR